MVAYRSLLIAIRERSSDMLLSFARVDKIWPLAGYLKYAASHSVCSGMLGDSQVGEGGR